MAPTCDYFCDSLVPTAVQPKEPIRQASRLELPYRDGRFSKKLGISCAGSPGKSLHSSGNVRKHGWTMSLTVLVQGQTAVKISGDQRQTRLCFQQFRKKVLRVQALNRPSEATHQHQSVTS